MASINSTKHNRYGWVCDLLILLAVVLAAAIGGLVTGGSDDPWYAELTKPPLNPPDMAFGIVWPVLYLFMAISAIIVRRKVGYFEDAPTSFGVFFLQLGFNLAWSVLFFFFHKPVWSLLDITCLFLSIITLIVHFGRYSKVAAALLVPYLLWVGFATYLNSAIVWLNVWPNG
mgnify:FL=1